MPSEPRTIEIELNDDEESKFESWEEDIRIRRDENGNILPCRHSTLFGNEIVCFPLPKGSFDRLVATEEVESVDEAAENPEDFDTKTQLELLNEWYVKPNFDLTEDELENEFPRAKLNEYIQALLLVSGVLKSEAETLTEDDIKNGELPTKTIPS